MSLTAFNRMRRNQMEAQKVEQPEPQEVEAKVQDKVVEIQPEPVELASTEEVEETSTRRRTTRRCNN